MPREFIKKWNRLHVIFNLVFSLMLIGLLAYYNMIYSLIAFLVIIGLIFVNIIYELSFNKEINHYIETITYRVKKVGSEVFQEMPIAILLYDDEKRIEWNNPYSASIFEEDNLVGQHLEDIIPGWKEDIKKITLANDRTYQLDHRKKERLIYITDITEFSNLLEHYESEKTVFGIIHLDNLDEVGQGMDDLSRSLLITDVTSSITDWASDLGIYLRRFTADKFFMVTNQSILEHLENSRFDILDVVREMTLGNKIPLTLSIGIGAGADTYNELGEMAQSSLDIALGRGGDQAAVKTTERLSFYGGKSNAVEKRTRVRARVISHALKDLIKESDQVLIMGHKSPDMDAIGASIGILKAVTVSDRDGYIILDETNPMIDKLLDEISKHKKLPNHFVTPEKAINMVTNKTLLIIVDTHKPSLTIEPKLLDNINRVVVIDHHRRGEEIVKDPVLIYIEPYASSTSELVTELLQYQSEKLQMDKLEATALLAGIFVDTKSFAYRTGARTFEAASFLKTNGADTILVQNLLKEDIDDYILTSQIVKNAKVIFDNIAISVADEKLNQILIAKAADTLLNMSGVFASFVISVRQDGKVSISARSLGQINVQVVMERLGGGGHLTNAAAQFENLTVTQAEEKLIAVLEAIRKEGGLNT